MSDFWGSSGAIMLAATVAAPTGAGAWIATHRRSAIGLALAVGIATALAIATYRSPGLVDRTGALGNQIGQQVGQQVRNGIDTVAGLFGARSPGERAEGALASLKGKKLLHQRALPKVRHHPGAPPAGVVGAPVIPPIATPPPAAPLYNVVNGAPPVAAPLVPGGPPIVGPPFGIIPGGPGGGGGFILPPIITPPVITPPITPPVTPPVTPPTMSGVPEPGSWAMMLVGFALVGGALRRDRRLRLLLLAPA